MKYFLRQFILELYNHGGIGFYDTEKMLSENGYKAIYFPARGKNDFLLKLYRTFLAIKTYFQLTHNDELVIVYPVYAKIHRALIKNLAKKKVKIICILVDIDGVRDRNEELFKQDISFLKSIKYFVAHNASMVEWVEKYLKDKVVSQYCFSIFLAEIPIVKPQKFNQIVFAGNLDKSPFLNQLNRLKSNNGLHFNLYGPGKLDFEKIKKIATWRGVYSPDELLKNITGSYGLIWDGTDFEKLDDVLGEYLKIITPHKASLYILCGMPLIVPENTAVAALVKQYGIGVTIQSLYEIEEKLVGISDEDYIQMQQNMQQLADGIASGEMLLKAIKEL